MWLSEFTAIPVTHIAVDAVRLIEGLADLKLAGMLTDDMLCADQRRKN